MESLFNINEPYVEYVPEAPPPAKMLTETISKKADRTVAVERITVFLLSCFFLIILPRFMISSKA
jgi:hypothetical protein